MWKQFAITVSEKTGRPTARIPEGYVWDLVEYLSYQRTGVTYSHDAQEFLVTFDHADRETAQRILNEWAQSSVMQPA